MRNRLVGRGRHRPSKPAPGRHEAIEAQIRDEIAVMQGIMISDLRQDEHRIRQRIRRRNRIGHALRAMGRKTWKFISLL
jgi:hypothetical protein